MNRELIYDEVKKLIVSFVIAYLVFQIPFYKESPLVILKILLSVYWLYVIPGIAILMNFQKVFDFKIRLVVGAVVGLAMYGMFSYYFGLLGMHVRYHGIIVPIILIVGSILVLFFRENRKK